MSIFQDVISKANSLFNQDKPQGLAAQPASPTAAPMSGVGAAKATEQNPSLLGRLFGHLTDSVLNQNSANAASTADPQDQARADRKKKREDPSLRTKILAEEYQRHKPEIEAWEKLPPEERKKTPDPTPKLSAEQVTERVHGKMLGDEYIKDPQEKRDVDPNEKIGLLQSKEDKIKFLSKFTQGDSIEKDKKENEAYCGPTSIIAAAVYVDGAKGLKPIIAQMQKDLAKTYKGSPDQIKVFNTQIKSMSGRIDKGEITNEDLDRLKEHLYNSMHAKQSVDKGLTETQQKDSGTNAKTMREYMKSMGLDKKLEANHMTMMNVDNDGDGVQNHYVLDIETAGATKDSVEHQIYDPYARKTGQLVTEVDQVDDYRSTSWGNVAY
jgi:hypothetical protein